MFLKRFLPKEGDFFELFNQHINLTVHAAEEVKALVDQYEHLADEQKHNQIAAIENFEKQADQVTTEIKHLTHKSFITPFDREQIHSLINSLDDITDLFQDIAKSMELYNIDAVNEDIKRFCEVNNKCCLLLQEAIGLLKSLGKDNIIEQIFVATKEISALESEADHIKRVAITNLFRGDTEVLEVVKLKELYALLEQVSNVAETTAELIEGIVLENS